MYVVIFKNIKILISANNLHTVIRYHMGITDYNVIVLNYDGLSGDFETTLHEIILAGFVAQYTEHDGWLCQSFTVNYVNSKHRFYSNPHLHTW